MTSRMPSLMPWSASCAVLSGPTTGRQWFHRVAELLDRQRNLQLMAAALRIRPRRRHSYRSFIG